MLTLTLEINRWRNQTLYELHIYLSVEYAYSYLIFHFARLTKP